ncbi:hypothetical protein VTK26DRAFT_9049 [Humicola hyalothermophila]
MRLLQLATALVSLGGITLSKPIPQGGDVPSGKYCDPESTICYSEYITPEGIAIRIAIPDTATTGNFSALLQIQAPRQVGWAGVAWGGTMVNNPLTVAWANGDGAVVSSRSASARTYPTPYDGASYTVLSGTVANSTHWTLSALAEGISSFGATQLDPSGTVPLAYAMSVQPPSDPASNSSRFSMHNSRGMWTHDLNSAKIADFDALVESVLPGTA